MKVSEMKYERYTTEQLSKDVDALIEKLANVKSGEQLKAVRDEYIIVVKHFSTAASLANMRFTLNTRDEFYLKEKDYYDEAGPVMNVKMLEFNRAFLNNKYRKQAEKLMNPLVFKAYECELKCADERIIPDMIEENKLSTTYSKLMSETMFEFNGESMPLSKLKKYFTVADRSVRRAAVETLGRTLESISMQLDDIYDKMVKVRDKMAKTLGFKNYVELGDLRMGRISYDRKMIAAFRENVLNDIVPLNLKNKKHMKEVLGITDDFMLYDNEVYCKQGNPEPVLNPEEMFGYAKKMYHSMSRETGEFFDMMLENDAFDVMPRDGKWGGGYCTSFADYRQPFILANFNGSSGDVDVLTHEAGHAFADYRMYQLEHDYELGIGGMETAETHSMSMEFFCWKYMEGFFGDRANDYRYMHVSDAVNFIPYGTIVDYFQQLCYEKPEMTPAERNALWLQLEEKFRPQLSCKGIPYLEKGTRWQFQMHIYESPLYYIDYCLAQSVALQFLSASRENYEDAFERYVTLLSCGGEEGFEDLIENAGLHSPFKKGALKRVCKDTENIIESLQNKI